MRRLTLLTLVGLAACAGPSPDHPPIDWEAVCGAACAAPPVQVDVGKGSSCVRYAGGAVLCWGDRRGTNWTNSTEFRPPLAPYQPRPPIELATTGAIDLSISGVYGCVVKEDASLHCWGDRYLALGTAAGSPVPVAVPGATDVVALGVGTAVCAVRADGAIMQPVHELIVNDEAGAVACEVGDGFACRILADESLECWGSNAFGKLGRGDRGNERGLSPVLFDHPVAAIALGQSHACALTVDGEVWCWGSNRQGQLGAETPESVSTVPVRADIDRVVAIRAGGWDTCAVRDDGQLFCWGNDDFGLRGGIETAIPTLVPGADDVIDVDIAANHGCLIRGSGEVACWGSEAYGALGQERASVPFGQLQEVTGLPHHGEWPADEVSEE